MGFGAFHPRQTLYHSRWSALRTAHATAECALFASFFHSGDVLRVFVLAVTVLGWPDAQEKLEGVAEIIAVVAVERIGAVVDGELGAETDVDAFAVRQVADVTERVPAHWKNFGFIERL